MTGLQLQRLGQLMDLKVGNPQEAEGVLDRMQLMVSVVSCASFHGGARSNHSRLARVRFIEEIPQHRVQVEPNHERRRMKTERDI